MCTFMCVLSLNLVKKCKKYSKSAFSLQKLNKLSFLYLDHNALESVPPNLPESLRVIHLQV